MVSFTDAVKIRMVRTKKVAHEAQPSVTDDHSLTSSRISFSTDTAMWNLIVSYTMKKQIVVNGDVIYASVLQ